MSQEPVQQEPVQQEIEGEGVRDILKDIKYRVLNFGTIRHNIPPYGREVLAAVGDKIILNGWVCRKPLGGVLNTISRLTTKVNYDSLFHLSMYFVLTNGNYVKLEKNEVVNIVITTKVAMNMNETRRIEGFNDSNNTLNKIINNSVRVMGDRFYVYNAIDNNCQVFVKEILKANGLRIDDSDDFILQKIYDGQVSSRVNDLFRQVTNLASRFNNFIYGRNVN